jgi:hypothetical protein
MLMLLSLIMSMRFWQANPGHTHLGVNVILVLTQIATVSQVSKHPICDFPYNLVYFYSTTPLRLLSNRISNQS